MRIIPVVLLLILGGCGLTSFLPLGGGSGTNVAANTQVGKENNQGFNTDVNRSVNPSLAPTGNVDKLTQDNSTTTINKVDPWMLLLLVLGWLAPSPNEIGRGFMRLFQRKQQ